MKKLYQAVKEEDPTGLVTYVNYPTTEYLELPFIDFVCFNVYLEDQERLATYLARLQNLAGDRPLVLAEVGLDSRRNGYEKQAAVLDWQIRTAFGAGCAGVFVFAWTDEWHRGGYDIEDWDFGLTDRDHQPKPALQAVQTAFAETPFAADLAWPRVSVVVCSYNGARTIGDCLDGLIQLDYPDYEVIVVDDGSTDHTAEIAARYNVRLIRTPNRGLSAARNTGWQAARGEIVAYIDDDAWTDPHWLAYLAATFMQTEHAGVGGPNIAPLGDGPIAECIANAPGGPTHVLVSDQQAEHIPGCNMAFRRTCLQAIGGFDEQFWVAGDDVDLCWRLQEAGWTLGFNPAAVVWHHCRNSIRAYWKQQQGYGKAEAMLEQKWPEKYNAAGHLSWAGRIYGPAVRQALGLRRERIYHGTWGSAPFQSLYQPASGALGSLPLMPEWYLVLGGLAVLSILGLLWSPLLLVVPVFICALGASVVQAGMAAAQASFAGAPRGRLTCLKLRSLTAVLHLLQPLARLLGRLRAGLTPWRWQGRFGFAPPRLYTTAVWSERWQAPEARLWSIEHFLKRASASVLRGDAYDRWDLEVRGGILGGTRLLMAVEEHGGRKQLLRFRLWPKYSFAGTVLSLFFAALAVFALFDGAWHAAIVLGVVSAVSVVRMVRECAGTTAVALHALKQSKTGGV